MNPSSQCKPQCSIRAGKMPCNFVLSINHYLQLLASLIENSLLQYLSNNNRNSRFQWKSKLIAFETINDSFTFSTSDKILHIKKTLSKSS